MGTSIVLGSANYLIRGEKPLFRGAKLGAHFKLFSSALNSYILLFISFGSPSFLLMTLDNVIQQNLPERPSFLSLMTSEDK